MLQSALTKKAKGVNLDLVTAKTIGLAQAKINLEHAPTPNKVVPKNKPNVQYALKYRLDPSQEFETTAFESESKSENGGNFVEQRKKQRRKAWRKSTGNVSSGSNIYSQVESELDKSGNLWLKRLMELEHYLGLGAARSVRDNYQGK